MLISIIIATYNRNEELKGFLHSLLAQEVPPDFSFEILMADNNSKDATKDTIDSYSAKFASGTMRYIFEPRQGKCFALNTAIVQSKGDILIFTDDDVILSKDWFHEINNFVKNVDFDAACGRVLPQYPQGIPAWIKENNELISGPILSYDYGTEIKPWNQKEMHSLIGANMIVKRRLFDEVGLFNTDLGPGTGTMGDDTEMCIRWEKKNKKLYYAGTVLAWHPVTKERACLKYIAHWNMANGKYEIIKDKWHLDDGIVCYNGIPRFLIRRIIIHALKLTVYLFNKKEFLRHWVLLFRDIGRAQAYRQHCLSAKKKT